MANNIIAEHRRLVAGIADDYGSRGYDVIIEPPGKDLPTPLSSYRPDLVAIGPHDAVFVEVRSKGKIRRVGYWKGLQDAVQQLPGWHLRLIANNSPEPESITVEDAEAILTQSEGLLMGGALAPALLLGWSGAEAAMRAAVESSRVNVADYRATTLISQLYSEGLLDETGYDVLRESMLKRNAVAHGFRQDVDTQDVSRLISVARELLNS